MKGVPEEACFTLCSLTYQGFYCLDRPFGTFGLPSVPNQMPAAPIATKMLLHVPNGHHKADQLQKPSSKPGDRRQAWHSSNIKAAQQAPKRHRLPAHLQEEGSSTKTECCYGAGSSSGFYIVINPSSIKPDDTSQKDRQPFKQ